MWSKWIESLTPVLDGPGLAGRGKGKRKAQVEWPGLSFLGDEK
jgi:hypothetical protein